MCVICTIYKCIFIFSQINLGGNVDVDTEAWELLKDEDCDSKFVGGLVTAVWGERGLAKRVFDLKRVKTERIPGIDGPLQTFSPEKYRVVKRNDILPYKSCSILLVP